MTIDESLWLVLHAIPTFLSPAVNLIMTSMDEDSLTTSQDHSRDDEIFRQDQHGPAWTSVDQRGPAWTSMDQHGPAWTNMDQHGPARTSIDIICHLTLTVTQRDSGSVTNTKTKETNVKMVAQIPGPSGSAGTKKKESLKTFLKIPTKMTMKKQYL
jgi:hypothetical protein